MYTYVPGLVQSCTEQFNRRVMSDLERGGGERREERGGEGREEGSGGEGRGGEGRRK